MPRYSYSCTQCGGYFQVWHGMKEMQESCQLCFESSCLVRVPQKVMKTTTTAEEQKVGQVTEDYIKQNNQLLKEMKKQARSQTYED